MDLAFQKMMQKKLDLKMSKKVEFFRFEFKKMTTKWYYNQI